MLRDPNLIPLSRQHQHALALCVRIDRASPVGDSDMAAWQSEIAQIFQSEIRVHFGAEENVLFPSVRRFPALETRPVSFTFGFKSLLISRAGEGGVANGWTAADFPGKDWAGRLDDFCCNHVCMRRREVCGTSRNRIPLRPLASCHATSPDSRTNSLCPGSENSKYTLHAGGRGSAVFSEVPSALRSCKMAFSSGAPG